MITERGVEILRTAEKQLRELVAEAAASGDYDAVIRVNEWARDVGNLIRGRGREIASPRAGAVQVPRASSRGATSTRTSRGVPRPARKKPKREKAYYPRFARDDNELVKTGWSRRKKREYRHRAPRRIVDALVAKVVELGARDLFSTDDIFPLRDPQEGHDVPSYQAYLCLAWLREEGLLEQKGRQGYVVADSRRLQEEAAARWDQLPSQ